MTKKTTIPVLIETLLLVLCFVTYPMALVIPTRMGVYFRYEVQLPTLFIATILCIVSLGGGIQASVAAWIKRHPVAGIGGTFYFFGLLTVWWRAGSTMPQIITFLSVFIIPAYCIFSPHPFTRRFETAMALLWGAHAAHGIQQLTVHSEMLGLTGNRNWAAAIIAATAPWAWRSACRIRKNSTVWAGGCAAVAGGITLLLMYHAHSLAAWLVLAIYLFLKTLSHQRCVWRWSLSLCIAVIIMVAVVGLKREAIFHRLTDDVRGPIWLSTVRMIADHPFAGVSPGAFRGKFTAYRTDWQMKSSKAASFTNHPHNEWLNIAAVGGLPAALIWGLAAMGLLLFKTRDSDHATLHYSAFFLVGCGMLDLTLFMPPTALPAFIFLGLYLRRFVPQSKEKTTPNTPVMRFPRLILMLALGLFACHYTWKRLNFGWHVRNSELAMEADDFVRARDESIKAHRIFPHEALQLYKAIRISLAALNDPPVSIRLGTLLMQLEPDLSHINWMLAVAYNRLGEPGKAIPFFKRESDLFPYSVRVQSDALELFVQQREFDMAPLIRERLARARFQHLIHELGRDETEKSIAGFRRAVSKDDISQATETATLMLKHMPPQGWYDPFGRVLAKTGQYPFLNEKSVFTGTDMAYWQKRFTPAPFPASDSLPSASRFSAHGPPGAIELAKLLHLEGWQTAAVACPDEKWPDMVDIRHGDTKALVLISRHSDKAIELIPDVGIEDLFRTGRKTIPALPGGSPPTVTLDIPVYLPDCLIRNQILGDILRRGKASGLPAAGASPALTLLSYWQLMSDVAHKDQFTISPAIQD